MPQKPFFLEGFFYPAYRDLIATSIR